jgi:phospholipid/cholesterol/gamma-HCH transport system substrate-binding protein
METRANYVLIGAFTLFGILGSLGLFLWLAKVEADR